MKIDVLTLFPEMFTPVTEASMLGRAAEKGILEIGLHNIRDYTQDKHNRTDDYPFGGGGGMVQMADPIFRTLEDIGAEGKRLLYMSPRGKIIDQPMLEELAAEEELVILCGHYEGVDQRVLDHWKAEEVSIGDYIVTGGELPAMVLIDAVARLIPGVLGNKDSALDESIYSGLLEHPQYTQPRSYRDMEVPEVRTSGKPRQLHLWRLHQALRLTARRRPDMLLEYA
ncbi:MAG: tRNA (guanosine(37)-N1)-methyltransferase TrmD, partial [Firmicutes bacterium]|nr:tRNA (guanosine(37)-N1)-methyltransferase TrmD [Bacillota bacterium]